MGVVLHRLRRLGYLRVCYDLVLRCGNERPYPVKWSPCFFKYAYSWAFSSEELDEIFSVSYFP